MGKFEDLLVNKGLYASFTIDINDLDEMTLFLRENEYAPSKIDCYCAECNEKRVFHSVDTSMQKQYTGIITHTVFDEAKPKKTKKQDEFNLLLNQCYKLTFRCARNNDHYIWFVLLVTNNTVIKIGQFPSYADLLVSNKLKYKSVLKDQYSEYNKAIGLNAHETGIGAFVYLRRIIEKLIFNTYKREQANLSIPEEEFFDYRFGFEKRLDVLKDYLPESLTKRANLYGIISKGIHELSEDECKIMFPVIKNGIEFILDDVIAKKERAAKDREIDSLIAEKTVEFKNKR